MKIRYNIFLKYIHLYSPTQNSIVFHVLYSNLKTDKYKASIVPRQGTHCQFTIIRGGCGPNGTFLKGYRVMSLSNLIGIGKLLERK